MSSPLDEQKLLEKEYQHFIHKSNPHPKNNTKHLNNDNNPNMDILIGTVRGRKEREYNEIISIEEYKKLKQKHNPNPNHNSHGQIDNNANSYSNTNSNNQSMDSFSFKNYPIHHNKNNSNRNKDKQKDNTFTTFPLQLKNKNSMSKSNSYNNIIYSKINHLMPKPELRKVNISKAEVKQISKPKTNQFSSSKGFQSPQPENDYRRRGHSKRLSHQGSVPKNIKASTSQPRNRSGVRTRPTSKEQKIKNKTISDWKNIKKPNSPKSEKSFREKDVQYNFVEFGQNNEFSPKEKDIVEGSTFEKAKNLHSLLKQELASGEKETEEGVDKWKKFGYLIAQSYDELKQKYSKLIQLKDNYKTVSEAQAEQIKKMQTTISNNNNSEQINQLRQKVKILETTVEEKNKNLNKYEKQFQKQNQYIDQMEVEKQILKKNIILKSNIVQDLTQKLQSVENTNHRSNQSINPQKIKEKESILKPRKSMDLKNHEKESAKIVSHEKSKTKKEDETLEYYKKLSQRHFEECTSLAEQLICLRTDFDKSNLQMMKFQKKNLVHSNASIESKSGDYDFLSSASPRYTGSATPSIKQVYNEIDAKKNPLNIPTPFMEKSTKSIKNRNSIRKNPNIQINLASTEESPQNEHDEPQILKPPRPIRPFKTHTTSSVKSTDSFKHMNFSDLHLDNTGYKTSHNFKFPK